MLKALQYFHHIHHEGDNHIVHHCSEGYEIKHCSCGKHSINISTATGHDWNGNGSVFEFSEVCPSGGFHVESGKENCSASFILSGKKLELVK